MIKRLQNIVSESRLTLPAVAVFATAVWLAGGLISQNLWFQFACFAMSAFLMMELNNRYSLIRIYSRMISCSFIVLSCTYPQGFTSINETISTICIIAMYIWLFRTYLDRRSPGLAFYSFLCIGTASVFYVHILFLVPVIWTIMIFFLSSVSWKNIAASVIGLILPYWCMSAYLIYDNQPYFFIEHFSQLGAFGNIADYSMLSTRQIIVAVFVIILMITGSIHYNRTRMDDKIKTRMLYNCFITTDIAATVFLILQPQHYDMLIRIIIVNTSPLTGHFLSLTRTRITGLTFYAIVICAFTLTVLNLWIS
ncbi:hypothetical protein [Xylanibacter muris]|uniref:Uncharacterized protein n=1 Tax=Xylanibacter muris TaxID=2736290 RepID=A0ABX2AN00_9BACT|nr:hypothetical protein [Xylanibacter muris]NPD92145.1 hypothetical protein [Xylanibacter muris]